MKFLARKGNSAHYNRPAPPPEASDSHGRGGTSPTEGLPRSPMRGAMTQSIVAARGHSSLSGFS